MKFVTLVAATALVSAQDKSTTDPSKTTAEEAKKKAEEALSKITGGTSSLTGDLTKNLNDVMKGVKDAMAAAKTGMTVALALGPLTAATDRDEKMKDVKFDELAAYFGNPTMNVKCKDDGTCTPKDGIQLNCSSVTLK